MKARNFFIYSVLYFIIVSFLAVFFFSDIFTSTKTIEIGVANFSKSIELKTYMWVGMPLIVYMVFAIFDFYTSFLLSHLAKKRLKKDANKFECFLEELVLDKKQSYQFKTLEFQEACELVKSLYYKQAGALGDKLNNAIAIKSMVENGEICDLKPFKLAKDNELFLKNEANKAKNDLNFAYNLLKNKNELSDEIMLNAYNNLILNGQYSSIKMLKIQKSKEDVKILLNRFINDDLSLSNAELEVLISGIDFSEAEYLQMAKTIYTKLEPNCLKSLFLKLKNEKEVALKAYLYLLAKLTLFDELLEEIHSSEANLQDFELIVFLKEQGKSYDVDKLIC